MNVKTFFEAYVETALWSSTDGSRDDGGDPIEDNYGPDDLAPECRREMSKDCADFVYNNLALLRKSGLTSGQAGSDFWLTRNGHGTGFWDRGLGSVGEALTKASKPYGSVDLYIGDDGKIHC